MIGALICAARLAPYPALRRFAAVWVSFLRGVPLLVQLLLVYYLLPVIGIDVPAMVAAVLTVGVCASAYISEIWRGAIGALPPGQSEAAVAIGMGALDIWTRVILPQAVSLSLPALSMNSSCLSRPLRWSRSSASSRSPASSQALAATTFRPLEVYIAAACIYLAINLCLAGARPLPRAQDGRLMDLSIFAAVRPHPDPRLRHHHLLLARSARSSAWRSAS